MADPWGGSLGGSWEVWDTGTNPQQIVSRRADTGLPDVVNGFLFSDGTYWADGFTWFEFRGSVLAGDKDPRPVIPREAMMHIFNERF